MNTKFEEVLIETPIEQHHEFILSSQEENFTYDNNYEMNMNTYSNNAFDHQISIPNYDNLYKLKIEPLMTSSTTQISIEDIETQLPIQEENKNKLKHFTSSFQYPTISFSNAKLPQIENIVATANLKCQLRLEELSLKIKNTEYNPEAFKGLIIKIAEPFSTVLILSSGKVICTGTKSEESAKRAIRKVAKIIHKQGYTTKISDIKIQNLICVINIQQPINLKDFAQKNNQFCSYNPELFPGLIFKMTYLGIKTIIFETGEMIFTGTNDKQVINKAFISIYTMVQQYKKRSSELRLI